MPNRVMGDATHVNVPALAKVPGLQLVAGYVTGSPDVRWTPADWALFPPLSRMVSIDQGFTGSPVPSAIVRDVEAGAWTPLSAIKTMPWTPPRPTIYCNRNDLERPGGVLDSGWQGDLWLAIPGWVTGDALPAHPGCTVVAVQNDFTHPAYDLSVVLDPHWPNLPPAPTWEDQLLATIPTIRHGDSGQFVRNWQGLLNAHGYSLAPYGIDGQFGDLTDQRTRDFQSARHLAADGVVGQHTWTAALTA